MIGYVVDASVLVKWLPVVTADIRFHDRVQAHPYLADRIVHVAQVVDPAH